MLIPNPFTPKVAIHFATKAINLLVKIALQNSKLLKDQSHTVNLRGR